MFRFLLILICLFTSSLSANVASIYQFNSDAQAQQFDALTSELRCVVCQNQNIQTSNASLANDLRNLVYQKIIAGENNQEIKTFIVQRYGDFVLYQPNFKMTTCLLWFFPFAMLFSMFIIAKKFFKLRS